MNNMLHIVMLQIENDNDANDPRYYQYEIACASLRDAFITLRDRIRADVDADYDADVIDETLDELTRNCDANETYLIDHPALLRFYYDD